MRGPRYLPRGAGLTHVHCPPLVPHCPLNRIVWGDLMRTRATILCTALLLAAVTGCSSDSDGDKPPAESKPPAADTPSSTPTPADAAGLKEAVEAYTEAYFKGDGDAAYKALSKRCKGKIDAATYGAVVDQAATDYGPDHPATDVHADVSGDLARVSYKVKGVPKLDQTGQPWTREAGAWKYDAC